MTLRSSIPDWSGSDFMAIPLHVFTFFFENARDIDVLKLYYHIHPTEVDLSVFS